ncbi:MAG: MBL fold metallo-hydrolase, partial [Sciscionella sp.]
MTRHPICLTCGTQFPATARDPERCPICTDERQYVNPAGQQWTTLEALRTDHRIDIAEETPGLWGVGVQPSFAIGQRALLVPGEGGTVMWDCLSYIDDAAVDRVAELGGIAAIAISHPHYYASMVEWSKAFGDVPIYIHEADRQWVRRKENVEYWGGTTREILPGRTLINTGVHFAGSAVLHWAQGAGGAGVLCSGDIVYVTPDPRWVSFMYSYPNLIPERPATVRRVLDLLEPWDFDRVYGAWWGRVVTAGGKA